MRRVILPLVFFLILVLSPAFANDYFVKLSATKVIIIDLQSGKKIVMPLKIPASDYDHFAFWQGKVVYRGGGGICIADPETKTNNVVLARGKNPSISSEGVIAYMIDNHDYPKPPMIYFTAPADLSGEPEICTGYYAFWSPSGRYLLIVGVNNDLWLYDTWLKKKQKITAGPVLYPNWTSANEIGWTDKWRIYRYNLKTGKAEVIGLPRLTLIKNLFFSPVGRLLAFNSNEHIYSFDIRKHQLVVVQKITVSYKERYSLLGWSSDGQLLILKRGPTSEEISQAVNPDWTAYSAAIIGIDPATLAKRKIFHLNELNPDVGYKLFRN